MTHNPETNSASDAGVPRSRYALIPAAVFLFILPFTHTVALRLLCLTIAFVTALYYAYRGPRPSLPLKLPLLFWAGISFLSVMWSIEPTYSASEFQNEVGYTLLAFLSFFYLTRSESDWHFWRLALTLSTVVISLFAFYYYAHSGTWVTTRRVGDHNAYSTYVVLIMPFLLLAATQSRGITRIFVWTSILLALTSGYLTFNRIMWIALTIEFVIFGSLYLLKSSLPGRKRALGALVIIVLCTLLSALFVSVSYVKSGGQAKSAEALQKYTTQDLRVQIWSYAKERIAQKPLTGYGFGRGILRKDFRERFNLNMAWHAHNMLLNYALEAGILGVAALLTLFAAMLWAFWKLYRSERADVWGLGLFGITLMAGLAVKSATDDILVRDNALLFWSLTGMALGLAERLTGSIKNTSSP